MRGGCAQSLCAGLVREGCALALCAGLVHRRCAVCCMGLAWTCIALTARSCVAAFHVYVRYVASKNTRGVVRYVFLVVRWGCAPCAPPWRQGERLGARLVLKNGPQQRLCVYMYTYTCIYVHSCAEQSAVPLRLVHSGCSKGCAQRLCARCAHDGCKVLCASNGTRVLPCSVKHFSNGTRVLGLVRILFS